MILLFIGRAFLISVFTLLLLGCGSDTEGIAHNAVPPIGARQADFPYQPDFQAIDHLFVLQNYELQDMQGPYPALGWLKDEFNAIAVTEMNYRSVHQAPQMDDKTFYRFTLIIETFRTPSEADRRLARLLEPPPREPNSEPFKEFPLRRGFAVGRNVFTVATDVNAFRSELERLAKELEPEIREKILFDL